MKVICNYCGRPAELVNGDQIYKNRKYQHLKFWLCRRCNAYVGCHKKHKVYSPDGTTPFGSLANQELRSLRNRVHNLFDPLWKYSKVSRNKMYQWLAGKMEMDIKECHIGSFNRRQCQRAIEILQYGETALKSQEPIRHNQRIQCKICGGVLNNKAQLIKHQQTDRRCIGLRKRHSVLVK